MLPAVLNCYRYDLIFDVETECEKTCTFHWIRLVLMVEQITRR